MRQLSNALFTDIAPKIERLQGSTEARQALVLQSLKYLDSLAQESGGDVKLQAELAAAYEKVAELQGSPARPNLGDFAGAVSSYEKANRIRRSLPETREHQLLLAVNFRGLAAARDANNDVAGALRDYAEALKIQENLLTKEPEADDLQTAHLETKFVVAEVHSINNQYGIAVPMLREIIHALERRDPNQTIFGDGLRESRIRFVLGQQAGGSREGNGESSGDCRCLSRRKFERRGHPV